MTSLPTGLEHATPVRITDTSATERAGFRKCRRQWFLTVVHRLDPQEGNIHFFLGTIYHEALAAYYEARKEPALVHELAAERALDQYQASFDSEMTIMKQRLAFLFPVIEPTWREAGELGLEMLQNYLDKEEFNPLFDHVIAVEFRVRVPIRSFKHRRIGWLSVQADAVGIKDGELIVVDHKTASREMSSAQLDLDDQLTAEVYSWWKAMGSFPERAVYNVSMKKKSEPPRVLKSGKLSKDKDQGTTLELYRQAIFENSLDPRDYEDMLTYLMERERRGEDPLFRREAVIRTPGQMAAFERDLYWEFRDMRDVAFNPSKAYPNPSAFNCPSCPVRVICTTIQDDGDVSAIIQAGYVIAEPRR